MNTELQDFIDLLSEKDDKIRYEAFLKLQEKSQLSAEVYPFWDTFREKLTSENSYQRSIGLMLIAENVRWDTENRMPGVLDDYLVRLHDERPITVRQCIQGLIKIVLHNPELDRKIAENLMSLNLSEVRETMRKSILTDILNVLLEIRKTQASDKLEAYIAWALSGEILDKKTKKQIEAVL